jgi:hypothetical protein
MSAPKPNLEDFIELTGEDRTGRALYRLWRWQPHTHIVRDGRRWVAWSRARWEQELHLTPQQFRLVLEKLSNCETPLILRKRYLRHGKVTMHLALSDECIIILANGPKHPNGSGSKHPNGSGSKHPNLLYKNTKKEPKDRTKTASGFAVAIPEAGKTDKISGENKACIPKAYGYHHEDGGKIIPFPKGQGGPDMSTTSEIGAKFAAVPKKAIDTLKADKVASLEFVWCEGFKNLGHVAPAVTSKVRGQFKHLIKVFPAGQAPGVLAYALEHWFDVTYAAEKHAGAFKSPEFPEIGYLVKFQHVAVELWLKSKAAPKATKSAPAVTNFPVQSIAQEPAIDPDDKPMTFAELQAMEAEELKTAS